MTASTERDEARSGGLASEPGLDEVNCLLCGHSGRTPRVRGWDRLCQVPGDFTLVECQRCGFLYLSPRPDQEEIKRYYPEEYLFYSMPLGDDVSPFVRGTRDYDLAKRCGVVLEAASGGLDLLDIGCAVGHFLGAMKAEGWRVQGVEPDARAAELARETYGVEVFNGYLGDAPFPPASFDAVTLWEVLEHVPNPLDTLKRIHDVLRPGGAIVLSVPNRGSLQSRIFGSYWIGYDFPRHFSVFSAKHIKRALGAAGFEAPRVISQRGRLGAMHNELLCVLASIQLWLGETPQDSRPRRIVRPAFRAAIANPAGIVALFLATLPYSILARKLNRGSQMVVVARKPGGQGSTRG